MFKKYKINPTQIYGSFNANHVFFRPDLYEAGTRIGIKKLIRPGDYNTIKYQITHNTIIMPYGDMATRTIKKMQPPSIPIILSAIEYSSI